MKKNKYEDIILMCELASVEIRENHRSNIKVMAPFISILLACYAYYISFQVSGTFSMQGLVEVVIYYLIFSNIVCFILVKKMCVNKNDLYYWKVPTKIFLFCSMGLINYLSFVGLNFFLAESFNTYIYFFVGIVICILLCYYLAYKLGAFSLHGNRFLQILVTIGYFPSIFVVIYYYFFTDSMSEIQIIIVFSVLGAILLSALIIDLFLFNYYRKIPRRDILEARLKKNSIWYQSIPKNNESNHGR